MIPSPTVLPNGELVVTSKKSRGKLLSLDEILLLKNTADALGSCDNREFLYGLIEKEFVTESEQEAMYKILSQAASQIARQMNMRTISD